MFIAEESSIPGFGASVASVAYGGASKKRSLVNRLLLLLHVCCTALVTQRGNARAHLNVTLQHRSDILMLEG